MSEQYYGNIRAILLLSQYCKGAILIKYNITNITNGFFYEKVVPSSDTTLAVWNQWRQIFILERAYPGFMLKFKAIVLDILA